MKQVRLCLPILAILTLPALVSADDVKDASSETTTKKSTGRKFAKKPLLRIWFNLDERAIGSYMRDVLAEYEVENDLMTRAMDAEAKNIGDKPELTGMLVLLVKGVIPSAAQIQFQSVKDDKDFRSKVMRIRNQMGSAGTLSGSGDHYELEMDFSKGIPIPGNDTDGDGEIDLIPFPGQNALGDNPAALAQLKQTIHFRRIGDIMWQGQVPELADMDLPVRSALKPPVSMDVYDVYGEFNLEEIPHYLKSLLFNTLNIAAKTKLQQRDEEDPVAYAARRANGDMWLELVRTVFYDVNKGKFTFQRAEGDQPVRARLELEARPASQLAKVGKTLNVGASRFGAIRNREVPFSIASTWGMPKMMQKLLRAQLELLRQKEDDKIKDRSAYDEMLNLAEDTIDSARVDTLFQITGNPESGFAMLGGLKLDNADEFQETLSRFLSSFEEIGAITWSEDENAHRYFSIDTGKATVPGRSDQSFETTIHLTVHDGCLWLCYGGPTALDLLKESVNWSMNNKGKSSGEPFQLTFDLSRLLQGDDAEDSDGVKQFPRRAALEAERKLEQGMNAMFAGLGKAMQRRGEPKDSDFRGEFKKAFQGDQPTRPSFLLKAMANGQDEIDLRLNISKKGIDLNVEIGRGLADMLVARMMDFQGRLLEMMSKSAAMGNQKPASASL